MLLEGAPVGELTEENNLWRFRYEPRWLARDSVALGPGLPLQAAPIVDGATTRPVQWFFDNLLPEEQLRTRLATERGLDGADAFGLLEAYGAESAGALTLLKPGVELPPAGRRELTDARLGQRIRGLPRTTLEAEAPKKMSLAGAQHKLPVIVEGAALFEPEGREASTHILKPNHPDLETYPESAANEWAVMQVAKRLQLDVPATSWRLCPAGESETGNLPIYLVERFDRLRAHEGGVHRLHAIDACQLLNIDRTYKSRAMTAEALAAIADSTRRRGVTRLRLFQWTLFNSLVGNRDAHLKNLSFLVGAGGIDLAPHYDLLCTAIFDAGAERLHEWTKLDMSVAVGGARTYADVSRESIFAHARELGIAAATAQRITDRLLRDAPAAMDAVIAEFESAAFPRSAGVQRAAALRVLRTIRHSVIEVMCRQLAPRTGT